VLAVERNRHKLATAVPNTSPHITHFGLDPLAGRSSTSSIIRSATIEEIAEHLVKLGAGNHDDNMRTVRAFPRHFLLSLDEQAFMDLVFLQIPTLGKIVPSGSDRRLRAVAQRASRLLPAENHLGSNWDLAAMLARFRKSDFRQPDFRLPPFVLRDTRDSERIWPRAGWYLQDGSHRALAYCMTVLHGEIQYSPQLAFCATSKQIGPAD
jgi:hypothetical protein